MADVRLDAVLRHVRKLATATDNTTQSDCTLLHAFVDENDQAAFTTLVKRHGPLVLNVCRRVLHNQEDAEDAFQATFILLARQAQVLGKHGSLAGWLHRVACHVAGHARRALVRRRRHEGRANQMRVANPELEVAWRDLQTILDGEIQRLPGIYREAFILCCVENNSGAEAARALGVQEGTVRSRLLKARERLRKALTRRGIELTSALTAAAVIGDASAAELSDSLVRETVKSSVLMATNKTLTTAGVSANVLAMLNGAKAGWFLSKAKLATATLLLLAFAGTGIGMNAIQRAGARVSEGPIALAVGTRKLTPLLPPEDASSRRSKKPLPPLPDGPPVGTSRPH